MNRASPVVPVAAFGKAALAAAEAAPAAGDANTWANFWTKYLKAGGIVAPASIVSADVPNWELYQRGRISFGPIAPTGADTGTTATLTAFGKMPDDSIVTLGEAAVTNILSPPHIEFDIQPGMVYAVRVTALTLSGATAITFSGFVQAFNVNVYVQAGN